MTDEHKILVVVDFDSDADNVVDRAVFAAKLLNCELDILLCDSSNSYLSTSFAISNQVQTLRDDLRDMQENFVETLATRAINAGIAATGTLLHERPIQDGIMSRADAMGPFIIMKATEFHSIAERSILVDTDWQLMRTCRYPLWLVKRTSFSEKPTIVAAVDPMHEHDKPAALDQVIVDTANAIAIPTGGEIHLIHTYERIAGIGTAANRTIKAIKLPIDEIDQRIKASHRTALDALAKNNGIDAEHTHQLPGRTRDIIPTFVRSRNADLVVMGALARWGIKRMVIGSTAERVLDHLPCDVLIVRDNEFQIADSINKVSLCQATRR